MLAGLFDWQSASAASPVRARGTHDNGATDEGHPASQPSDSTRKAFQAAKAETNGPADRANDDDAVLLTTLTRSHSQDDELAISLDASDDDLSRSLDKWLVGIAAVTGGAVATLAAATFAKKVFKLRRLDELAKRANIVVHVPWRSVPELFGVLRRVGRPTGIASTVDARTLEIGLPRPPEPS